MFCLLEGFKQCNWKKKEMLIKLVWNHFDWKYIVKYNLSILLANYYKFYHVISKHLIIIDQRVITEYQVVGNHMSNTLHSI